MTDLFSGRTTFHTRADAWECDFNGHWNTKYYCRSVQAAAEVAASLSGQPGLAVPPRLMRFHSELRAGDPVVIHSCNLRATDGADRIAHILTSEDKIAATALDDGCARNPDLPDLPETLISKVQPRGLPVSAMVPWTEIEPRQDQVVELGPVEEGETYPDGRLHYLPLASRLAIASHHHAMGIGYTMGFTARTGIGRMLVEMRSTPLGPAPVGTFLRGVSRIVSAEGKAYRTAHRIETHAGTYVAMFELAMLAVDMTTRRATQLPDFVTAALS